jgi:ligand-binding SRPBCC domain-containing protein
MAIHCLQKTQKLNLSISEVWDFISSPKNLKEITPDYMGFEILTDLPEKMYAGQIIQYKVTPLLNIPMSWCTEITHVKEHEYFVDEQRQGPYQFWHHQHHIKPIKNGVEMLDIVHYQAPFGFIGELVTPLIVTKKLEEIFEYRFNKLIQLFGEYKEG